MTEWTTIRVRQDAKDRADELKDDNTNWSEWIADEARAPEIPTQELSNRITADLLSQLPPKIADELQTR